MGDSRMRIDLSPAEIHLLAELVETAVTREMNTRYNVEFDTLRTYVHLYDKLKQQEEETRKCLDS